jgi:hypothetical protein
MVSRAFARFALAVRGFAALFAEKLRFSELPHLGFAATPPFPGLQLAAQPLETSMELAGKAELFRK